METISCLYFPCDYTVVDVETTRTPEGHIKLIEVAAVRIRGNTISDKCFSLLNPGCHIVQDQYNKSGLCDRDVESSPSFSEFLPVFLSFIGSDTIVGHNISYDISCINKEAGSSIPNPIIDTLRLAQELHVDSKYSLDALCNHFNILSLPQHRALSDCYSTYLLYTHLLPLLADALMDSSSIPTEIVSELDVSFFNSVCEFFRNKRFLFTGDFKYFNRIQLSEKLKEKETFFNMKLQSNVNGSTDCIIIGDNAGPSKLKKIQLEKEKGHSIDVISEDFFIKMISGDSNE